jgi:hypothetical protein
MTRPGLARQLQAVTLAHYEARDQLQQRLRAGGLSEPERELAQQHVLALRAARETFVTFLRDQAARGWTEPGATRLAHDAMVAGDAIPTEELAQ